MFGWLRPRVRSEDERLLRENFAAASYPLELWQTSQDEKILQVVRAIRDNATRLMPEVSTRKRLPSILSALARQQNQQIRQLYQVEAEDGVEAGAKRNAGVMYTPQSFDEKFKTLISRALEPSPISGCK